MTYDTDRVRWRDRTKKEDADAARGLPSTHKPVRCTLATVILKKSQFFSASVGRATLRIQIDECGKLCVFEGCRGMRLDFKS
jgi:hypothetical protein